MQQIIAERVFTLKLPRNKSQPVTARVFAARRKGDYSFCRCEVDGLSKRIRHDAFGVDSIQAIESAFQYLGYALNETREWREGNLLLFDNHDLGLPLGRGSSWETYMRKPLRFVSADGLSYINLLIAGTGRGDYHIAAEALRDGFYGGGGGYVDRHVLVVNRKQLAKIGRGIIWSKHGELELRINTRAEGRFASLRVGDLPSGCSVTVTIPIRLRDVRAFTDGLAAALRRGGANAPRVSHRAATARSSRVSTKNKRHPMAVRTEHGIGSSPPDGASSHRNDASSAHATRPRSRSSDQEGRALDELERQSPPAAAGPPP